MGGGAYDALYRASMDEEHLDRHLNNWMSDGDAYDLGLIDELGTLGHDGLIIAQNKEIPTLETCNRELRTLGLQLDVSNANLGANEEPTRKTYKTELKAAFPNLNERAIFNLFKSVPSCNCCGKPMTARDGKFGKFYFCENKCDGQKTVSDVYWKSLKRKLESI